MNQELVLITQLYNDPTLAKVNISCGVGTSYVESYILAEDGQILLTELDVRLLTEQQ